MFSNSNIQLAVLEDATSIQDLLNKSYRGETSKKGWTTEAFLIDGEIRVNEQMVLEVMNQSNSVFLKYVNLENKIVGCVNLQKHNSKVYLGMFSVKPELQGVGLGKEILKASEEYAFSINCNSIYMSVISLRTELINWYKRNGYVETGEIKSFDEDGITGKHLQKLEFMILEKQIA